MVKTDVPIFSSKQNVLAICIFLVAITWLAFGQALQYDFTNYDDQQYVFENLNVTRGLTAQGILWAFTHVHAANWHPLTSISHMLDCQLFGLKAGQHHLTNVLLHIAAAVLLFLILREMTGALWRSAFVAAIFAVHPLHVESVAWIAERKDVLSSIFFMLTLGAYTRYARAPSPRRYITMSILFALGLVAKPMLVTLPFLLLLLDYWPLQRFAEVPSTRLKGKPVYWLDRHSVAHQLIREKVPLLLLSAASCAATLFAQKITIHSIENLPLSWRINNAVVAYVAYLWQTLWPVKLAVFYPHPKDTLPLWQILLAIAFLVAFTAVAFAIRKKRPYLLTGWLWFVGMLVPVIGLVQAGDQAHADRYMYLPQIGLCLLITWAVGDVLARWHYRRVIVTSAGAALIAALAWRASIQTSYWRNSESLWTHALAVTRDNDTAHNGLCDAFLREGRVNEAISHAQIALNTRPDSADANNNLGVALSLKGQLDEALIHFETVLKINPRRPRLHYNIATVLLQKGQVDDASAHF